MSLWKLSKKWVEGLKWLFGDYHEIEKSLVMGHDNECDDNPCHHKKKVITTTYVLSNTEISSIQVY